MITVFKILLMFIFCCTEQLTVGVGALAGSTIMLLTIPWFLSIVGGRVNIDAKTGKPRYKTPKLEPEGNFSLTGTGVAVSAPVNAGAYTILLTSVSYFLLQVPGLAYLNSTPAEQAKGERTWAIIGTVACVFFFGRYLYQQYLISNEPDTTQQMSREEYLRKAIADKVITLAGVMTAELQSFNDNAKPRSRAGSYQADHTIEEGIALKEKSALRGNGEFSDEFIQHLERILKPFFKAYDPDNSDTLDIHELRAVFADMGEYLDGQQLSKLFAEFDTNKNGTIDYSEFVRGTAKYIASHERIMYSHSEKNRSKSVRAAHAYLTNDEEAEEGDEEEEVPEDMKDLSPEEQQSRIKKRAAFMMGMGTLIVLLVSDPMVDVMSEIGKRTNIPAFYVAFVLAPLASNASELIAAYNYAQKKTANSITISLATLEGACIMNNTFVLGIFMLLIWTQNLAWEFFAETLTILFVQVIMAMMALKKTHTVMDGFLILSLYPLSLGMVAFLEYLGWN